MTGESPEPKVPYSGAAVLSAGFRPFFLATGVWAVVALALFIAALAGVVDLPSRFDPITWHIHEMVFGFVMAAVGGFLLTAVANWTGRPPVSGTTLALLTATWVAGRAACLVSALLPAWLGVAADLAFPAMLTAVAARELWAAGDRRNYRLLTPLALLGVANILMHLQALDVALPIGLGGRLGVFCVMVLLSVIGGRILPAFTRNWLTARGAAPASAAPWPMERLAMAALHSGLLVWVFLPGERWVGVLLLAGAATQLWRMARWHGLATLREPLLLILHVGYLWLPIGLLLLGLSLLSAAVPPAAGIHALTTGAFGTMILAVMTRATLGHTGRALHADGATVAMYLLVTAASVLRVAAAWPGAQTMIMLEAAAAAWIAVFALFVVHYGPMLIAPRPG